MKKLEFINNLLKTHKQKLIFTSWVLISFVSGFAVSWLRLSSDLLSNHSEIKTYKQSSFAKKDSTCPIKAKANSKGILTYHLPGQAFYNTLKDVVCFTSEEDAKAAGYVKASR